MGLLKADRHGTSGPWPSWLSSPFPVLTVPGPVLAAVLDLQYLAVGKQSVLVPVFTDVHSLGDG